MGRHSSSARARALPRLARGAVVASLIALGVASTGELSGPELASTSPSTTASTPTSSASPAPSTSSSSGASTRPSSSPSTAPAPSSSTCEQASYTAQDGRTWYWCLPPRGSREQGASVNGWPPDPDLMTRTVPGTTARLVVRRGAAGELLLALALRYDRLVEGITGAPGTEPDDWGYHDRKVRGEDTAVSDHASGTAIDLNALCHGLDTDPAATFSVDELRAIGELVEATGGVIEWGGDESWSQRYDPMHFALAPGTTEAQAEAALRAIGGVAPPELLAAPSRPSCVPT